MRAAAIGIFLAGCGADPPAPEAFDVDRCELATMQLFAFDRGGLCEDGAPRTGGGLPAPVDEATFEASGDPGRLHLPTSDRASVVALCLDEDDVVRRWGCDDDSDGRLDVRLVDACAPSDAECDPARPGGLAWTGAGGTACVADCGCDAPDNAPADRTWTTETVDAAADWDHAVIVASDGTVHLSVLRPGAGLRHFQKTASGWIDEEVDVAAQIGGSSIAEDAKGAIHMTYYGVAGLRHATNASGVWTADDVDDTAGYGGYWSRSSLATHGTDLHVAYMALSAGDPPAWGPRYAVFQDGSWAWEEIVPRGGNAGCPMLAVEASGRPHMTYQSADLLLVHATKDGDTWTQEAVDAVSCSNDPVIDSRGALHVAYMAPPPAGLRYATNASGSWASETVDPTPNAGFGSAIAMTPGCGIHVTHTTFGPAALRFATGRAGAWSVEQIGDPITFPTTLAVDATGALYSGYSHGPEGGPFPLLLAVHSGADGIDQNCDGVDGVDADGDGHASLETLGDDCDDGDTGVHPGAPDEAEDGVDQDCDCRDGP